MFPSGTSNRIDLLATSGAAVRISLYLKVPNSLVDIVKIASTGSDVMRSGR